jgi:protein TonB
MAASGTDHQTERFGFTVFLSACVHAMVILGVGFSYLEELTSAPTMEITLAQYRSEVAPEEADFLAQENQSGSGTLQEVAAPSTPFTSEFNADVIQDVSPLRQTMAARSNSADTAIEVLTASQAEQFLEQNTEEESSEAENPEGDDYTQEELSLAIASLQAQLDLQREAYARKPRKYTISSASTRKSEDALYLDSWRKRIESVGNLNYPQAARRQQIYGDLRLLVALNPDGSLNEVLILKSSNSAILDRAAIEIVNLAAPFEPFPAELIGQYDILEIIRTWRFQEGAAFSTE